MSKRLADKVCVITGTGGTMGRCAARLFASEGALVVGCDINASAAAKTVAAVQADGNDMMSIHPCDLTDAESARALIAAAIERHGKIDVLYNNCGMAYFEWFPKMPHELFKKTISEELDVYFHVTQAAWPHLVAAAGASVINVASASAKIPFKVLPAAAHMAAKGAVLAWSRQLAMEGGPHGIRVNTISPGVVETNQTRQFISDPAWWGPMRDKLMIQRPGQPDDIVPAAIYLASEESRWVTGADLAIDGGASAW
ncbi:oxidoreductase [Sphingobium lactosutens]|mgnify:FL=1|uniref:SDR family NAD(P)-dependent oxidoreductase n=1 Tax=Sphingobium lactosutens TaxID=522773 RepID=UPI0015BFAB3A|nr:SDR family oxidoreductase [Sphingobium lactosutens]NWK97494.1 oxidoreductase [Sphingobium lactosutens]